MVWMKTNCPLELSLSFSETGSEKAWRGNFLLTESEIERTLGALWSVRELEFLADKVIWAAKNLSRSRQNAKLLNIFSYIPLPSLCELCLQTQVLSVPPRPLFLSVTFPHCLRLPNASEDGIGFRVAFFGAVVHALGIIFVVNHLQLIHF